MKHSVPLRILKAYESDVLLKVFAHIDNDVLYSAAFIRHGQRQMIAKALEILVANSQRKSVISILRRICWIHWLKRDGEL